MNVDLEELVLGVAGMLCEEVFEVTFLVENGVIDRELELRVLLIEDFGVDGSRRDADFEKFVQIFSLLDSEVLRG